MFFRRKVVVSLALVFATCLALGCGHVPTAPNGADVVSSTGAVSATGPQRTAQSDGLFDAVGSLVDGLVKLVVRTLRIVGGIGGSLSNGRWRVDVPPNAIEGTATISLGVTSATSPACDLGILPAEQNSFDVPVTLTADCGDVSSDRLATYTIFWYDPDTRTWVPVEGSTVDLANKQVRAPLRHFSAYAVGPKEGKSGW